ncbi:MAG: hypothetical protein IRZ09_04115 [Variibacter sp.]|nr:hypothetical protein [Variibacter sp.]
MAKGPYCDRHAAFLGRGPGRLKAPPAPASCSISSPPERRTRAVLDRILLDEPQAPYGFPPLV